MIVYLVVGIRVIGGENRKENIAAFDKLYKAQNFISHAHTQAAWKSLLIEAMPLRATDGCIRCGAETFPYVSGLRKCKSCEHIQKGS